jgi:hypothetical protein
VGPGRSRGGDVAPGWGGACVAVWVGPKCWWGGCFFTDRDESAKTSRCCGPYCDEFNKSSCDLGFNIHPCMSVTKKYEYVVESWQTKQIVAVFVTKKGIRRRIVTNLTNRRSVLGFDAHPWRKKEYVVESRWIKEIVAVFWAAMHIRDVFWKRRGECVTD